MLLRQVNSCRGLKDYDLVKNFKIGESILRKHGATMSSIKSNDTFNVKTSAEKADWDKEYWQEARIAAEYNPTVEIFQHIEDIMAHLRKQGHADFKLDIR